jgi:APA family basic amino acid/polyamine antiporter
VLGVIKLRITHPELPRPYRAWGYPITPLVFLLVTGFMMYYLLTTEPLRSVLSIAIMISGLLIYAVFLKQTGKASAIAPLGGE